MHIKRNVLVGAVFAVGLLLPFAASAAVGPNLIPNGNLESITGWNPVYGTGNSTGFSYPAVGVDGGKAAHIKVSAYSRGDIFWQPQGAPVTPGQQYQFTGYSRSSVSVVVIATYVNSSGSAIAYATLGTVAGTGAWLPFTATITPPAGAAKVRIQHVIRAVGTLDVDNYYLGLVGGTSTPPPTCSLAANPASIAVGSSTTLTFSSTNATAASINNGIGAVPTSGTKLISPATTTLYTGTWSGAGGTTTCSAAVTVTKLQPPPPPPLQKPVITSFTANPTNIVSGQSTQLAWVVAGASSTAIDQGIGAVAASANRTVSPTATTTYTLSAANPAGTTTAQVTVGVTQPLPPPPPPPTNLIQNGNLESGTTNNPTGWAVDYWGSMTPTFTYPVTGNGGGKAARVTVSSFTSGAAEWAWSHITDSTHAQYQFNEDYMATVPTELDVEFLMQDGTYQYTWLQTVQPSATWQTLSAQVTPPPGAVSFTVLHLLARAGTLTVDNASLAALTDPFAQGMVTLSFDDNLISQFQNARPILNTAGFKGTYFVITQDPGTESIAMSWANLTTLKNEGNEIAGHTQTHAFLTQLTPAQMVAEVSGSFADLVAQGFSPQTFAYPYGDVSPAVEAAVKAAGYAAARGSYTGVNGPVTDHYSLYDIRLDTTSNLATIQQYIDQAKADKRWIIFEIHDVLASGGDTYSITPAFLQSVVTYLKSSGISVVTMQQGMAQLNP